MEMELSERARIHGALADERRLKVVDALRLNDLTPSQICHILSMDSNLVAHHLSVLEDAGLVTRNVSAGDARRRYVRLVDTVDLLETAARLELNSVLFVCTHNSARSQFAEALIESRSDIEAQSAGLRPGSRVHPKAVTVAAGHGLDLSVARPKTYSEVSANPDLIISVCDRACEAPIPFEARRLHWSVPDPVDDGRLDGFRSAFAQISRRVDQLVAATR